MSDGMCTYLIVFVLMFIVMTPVSILIQRGMDALFSDDEDKDFS